MGRDREDAPSRSWWQEGALLQVTPMKRKSPKAERFHLHGNGTQGLFSFLSADDGPYSKGGKDAGGTDVALACRRQSIPGKEPLFSFSFSLLCPGGIDGSELGVSR